MKEKEPIHGSKRIYNNVFYFCKAHFCPDCGGKLDKTAVSKVINSLSEEAKNFDFSCGDVFLAGNVKFTWNEFECSVCKKHFSVNEIKLSERK